MKKRTKAELVQFIKFSSVGAIAIAVDFLVYNLLLMVLPHAPSKGISFSLGIIVAYVLNKYWTFGLKGLSVGEILRYFVVSAVGLGLNVGSNEAFLRCVLEREFFAFTAAVAVSGTAIYLGQKFWVFRKTDSN